MSKKRVYTEEQKAQRALSHKLWREKNREFDLERKRKYAADNAEILSEKRKAKYWENPEKEREQIKLWKKNDPHRLTRNSWRAMKSRCQDPNSDEYFRYGGSGITVIERWNEFENFLADMGERTDDKLSIERIDGTKGYYKENCKWATKEEQGNNSKINHPLTYNGKTQNVSQWARELKIPVYTLYQRISKGWTDEETLSIPRKEPLRILTYNGKTQSMVDWARELGFTRNTLSNRINTYGWSIEKALSTPLTVRIKDNYGRFVHIVPDKPEV